MKLTAKNIALCAALTALAIGLSLAERLLPLELIAPLPGIKLGLANIVTMFALLYLGRLPALGILICRCFLSSFVYGGPTYLLFSLAGGLAAYGVMCLAAAPHRRVFTLWGISILGAAAHNLGQTAAACLMLGSLAAAAYLPLLLVSSLIMGSATAALSIPLFARLEKTGIIPPARGRVR